MIRIIHSILEDTNNISTVHFTALPFELSHLDKKSCLVLPRIIFPAMFSKLHCIISPKVHNFVFMILSFLFAFLFWVVGREGRGVVWFRIPRSRISCVFTLLIFSHLCIDTISQIHFVSESY